MKRALALILALVMTMALVACGGDKPTSSAPSNPTQSSKPTEPSKPADPAKPTEPTLTKAEQLKKDNADKYGGEINQVATGAAPTMDIHSSNAGSLYVCRPLNHVYEGIATIDANGKYYPMIMDFEQSADGCTITFTMKERYFSNGEKITIEDVEASFRRYVGMHYTTQSGYDKIFKGTTFKVEGDKLIFQTESYNINLLSTLASGQGCFRVMPKEICEKWAPDWTSGNKDESNGLIWGCLTVNEINDVKDLIGSGPYCVEEWNGDTKMVFVRNENYEIIAEGNEDAIGLAAPRMAYIDKINYIVNPDTSSQTAATLAGEYDIGAVQSAMWDTALSMGLKRWDAGTSWTHGIFFNLHESNADSPVADVNVRKAIRAIIDPQAILMAVAGIIDRVVLDPYPVKKDMVDYASTLIEENDYNLKSVDKAKEYLAKSSYNGEPIVYLCHASGNFYKATMAAIPMLESIGLKVELMAVDNGSHTAMRKDPKTGHDIGCWEVQKNEINPVLHSTFVTGSQGWWASAAKDDAIKRMQSTPTGSPESVKAYNDYLQAVVDEVPYILFGHLVGYTWSNDNVVIDSVGQTTYWWNNYLLKK